MSQEKKRLNKSGQGKKIVILVVLILLIMLFFLYFFGGYGRGSTVTVQPTIDTSHTEQVLKDCIKADTTNVVQSVKKDTTTIVTNHKINKKTITQTIRNDSVKSVVFIDTVPPDTLSGADSVTRDTSMKSDTVEKIADISPCLKDTSELWVYPDPSGGLHRHSLNVEFYANRACTIKWRMKGSNEWVEYHGGKIQIEKTGTLVFSATDSCGKAMAEREEYFEISEEKKSVCPADMGHVVIGDVSFCIDNYEWPNKKGVRPVSYISFYQAGDSCFSAGKRLCSTDEWMLACSGPYSSRFPYGDKYEERACVTADSIVHVSGSKPECRSFFGMYDMSGNLLEWTDTRAAENSRYYYVTGGFWESGIRSSCSEKRYSYFTENRHNPVGFRCCKDASGSK